MRADIFKDMYDRGMLREYQVANYLEENALTDYDVVFLQLHNISVSEILNGQYHSDVIDELKIMTERWNRTVDMEIIRVDML